jgi:hypothetical protein
MSFKVRLALGMPQAGAVCERGSSCPFFKNMGILINCKRPLPLET